MALGDYSGSLRGDKTCLDVGLSVIKGHNRPKPSSGDQSGSNPRIAEAPWMSVCDVFLNM